MFTLPRLDRITQGTIFCGGVAEGYDGKPVWGVVITARCDAVHDKTPIINYLPLVRVEDWLSRNGGLLAIEKALSDTLAGFKNMLTHRSLSHSLMEVYPLSELAAVHFPEVSAPYASKKEEKEAQLALNARRLAADFEILESCQSARIPDAVKRAVRTHRKVIHTLAENLVGQKIAGYYYVPDIGGLTDHQSALGYVIHLREVRYIGRMTANVLAKGLSREDSIDRKITELAFDAFDFAFPVSELVSPWIEHLMQTFCSLFGRIGVTDIDKSLAALISGAVAPDCEENV